MSTPTELVENVNRPIRSVLPVLALWLPLSSLAAVARTTDPATRTLQQAVKVPAGDGIAIENLAGRVRLVRGTGPFQVNATVVAGGDQAQTLAKGVKVDVSTMGKQVLVHVHYPVDRYNTFLYSPQNAQAKGSGKACILGKVICFHGRSSSTLRYQGQRVRVNQSENGGSGAPLYVNVVAHVPADVSVSVSNALGLLEVDGLADNLNLATQGNIHVRNFNGQLSARTDGGDAVLTYVTSSNASVNTHGGNIFSDGLNGNFDLETWGGDFTGNELRGDFRLATWGGNIAGNELNGDFNLTTWGGDTKLNDVSGRLAVSSRGGDLTVSGNLGGLASLKAESGGGDIALRASNLALHLNASSGSGDISVQLSGMRNVNSSSSRFSGDIGKATGTAELHSGGGDITVTQP